jgi:cytochrome c biogenesis protein CcmG/thiol:disulfide interchange protein DsbE
MMRFILPLVAFLILAGFLYAGLLGRDPHEVPSPLIDKPAPAFSLPQLHEPAKQFSAADMKGKVWLLNVWASWCVSCRDEHPVLMALSQQNIVPIYGLAYKDKPEDAKVWLQKGGNPYTLVAQDRDGRVGIDYGVYGVPETYVIDKQGVIRYKQIGVVTPKVLSETILPLVEKLGKES